MKEKTISVSTKQDEMDLIQTRLVYLDKIPNYFPRLIKITTVLKMNALRHAEIQQRWVALVYVIISYGLGL